MWSREEIREYEDMRDWLLTCAGINPAVMERLMATLDEVSPPTHGGGGDGQPQSYLTLTLTRRRWIRSMTCAYLRVVLAASSIRASP